MATEVLESSIPAWQPEPAIVRRSRRESHDTVTLYLQLPEREEGSHRRDMHAGQFNMLYLFGKGEAPISVSGVSRRYVHHTVKAAGALTSALTELKPGDRVGLRGPFGRGWPLEQARKQNVLLIAGGIGMAPIRAAVREIMRHRGRYKRVDLVYGARTPADILFDSQLQRWQAHEDINVHVTVDHSSDSWDGPVGFVTSLLPSLGVDADETIALLCGPEIMMRHGLTQLINIGVDANRIYLSMERNMRCAIGLCGHCQWGADFICRQGPVFSAAEIRQRLQIREL